MKIQLGPTPIQTPTIQEASRALLDLSVGGPHLPGLSQQEPTHPGIHPVQPPTTLMNAQVRMAQNNAWAPTPPKETWNDPAITTIKISDVKAIIITIIIIILGGTAAGGLL